MSPAAKMPGALVSQKRVDRDAAIDREAGLLGERQRGRTPTPATTRSAPMVPPLFERDVRSSIASRFPRWNTTPCSSCRPRTKSPICGPSTRSSGRCSGATTCTSTPRARSDGGDLETDEARAHHDGAPRGRRSRDDGAAVGERPQRVHVREVHPGSGNRIGSAPVASSSRP